MQNTQLQKIATKYQSVKFNENNYSIGGGLSSAAFASRRHQDAKFDEGKLTEGKASQLFKKATGLELDYVKEVINYAVPNMEWHHAGRLPKSYGGGMKKTYFLNAAEIVDLATNWQSYCEKYELSLAAAKEAEQAKRNLEERKLAFLQANAQKKVRTSNKGIFFIETAREMEGKYGWFDSRFKSYNLPEFFTGWEFPNEQLYNQYLSIK